MSAELIIDPEFRDLIRPLDDDELDQLHESLALDGCLSPLIVWKGENILVDGHNRYAYCVAHETHFTTVEKSFVSRDDVKAFMLLNQLARRNITPTYASVLRGELYAIQKKYAGAPEGNDNAEKQFPQNEGIESRNETAEIIAKQTGVSRATVERDAKLVEALKKLGISPADFADGKVLDAKGKKRSKGSIIAEAFPPKRKKEKPAPTPTVAVEVINQDESILDEYDSEEPPKPSPPVEIEPWTIALLQLPKMTKPQRQELHDLLETRWDCKQRQS